MGPRPEKRIATGFPMPLIAPMCRLPKYFAQVNSPSGMVPPNPKPYMKNAGNRMKYSPVAVATSIRMTPVAEIMNAASTSRRGWTRWSP